MGKNRQLTRASKDEGRLVNWLNDERVPLGPRERIAAIARDLCALSVSGKHLRMRVPTPDALQMLKAAGLGKMPFPEAMRRLTTAEFQELDTGLRLFDQEAGERVSRSLNKYRFRPYINAWRGHRNARAFIAMLVPETWNIDPTVAQVESGSWPGWSDIMRGSAEEQEGWMVLTLMNLSSSGKACRLRQCECDRWFYAGHMKKQHCSDTCRKRASRRDRSPNQIERRREYMRDYQREARARDRKRTKKGGN